MQKIGETTYKPDYLERMVIYFTHTEHIVVTMGNRQWRMTVDEPEKLLRNKLTNLAAVVEIFKGNGEE
jgi:hypothetical protein